MIKLVLLIIINVALALAGLATVYAGLITKSPGNAIPSLVSHRAMHRP